MHTLQLWRHATLFLTINGKRLLLDPMLSPKEAMDPITDSIPQARIPMVELPFDPVWVDAQLRTLDGVVVTHLHRDHWDIPAQMMIPRDIPLFCQPVDEGILRNQGFDRVTPIVDTLLWESIKIIRTGGPITMSDADIGQVANHAPQAKIIVVHLDTVNHCHQTRETLVEALSGKSWKDRVIIPRDGDVLELSN